LHLERTSDRGEAKDRHIAAKIGIASLTRRLAQNDEAAYREFYHAWSGRLWRYLVVATHGDEHLARDALQATMLKVVRYIRVFRDDDIFWSWLTVLARTALSDQRKTQNRYRAFLERLGFFVEVEHSAATQSANHRDEHLHQLLEEAMSALPADERELIEAKYYGGQSVRALAEHLHLPEKTVESRLTRLRQKLKDALFSALRHEPRT
jgi:RNA polymerase sigma-70 factor, ECF subfamily